MADARRSTHAARRAGMPEATVAGCPSTTGCWSTSPTHGVGTVSSDALAATAGVSPAKLRKDLSFLGSYGTRGVGYDVADLLDQIGRELGITSEWPVVIVGVGNLGHALANYGGFASRGFRLVALVDADPQLGGTRSPVVTVRPFADLPDSSQAEQIADRRRSRPRQRPPSRSPTRWSRPASAASSTSRRSCCRCPTGSTCAGSTSPASCRSWPSTSSASSRRSCAAQVVGR